jgi:hypothetical protein
MHLAALTKLFGGKIYFPAKPAPQQIMSCNCSFFPSRKNHVFI